MDFGLNTVPWPNDGKKSKLHLVKKGEDDNMESLAVQQLDQASVTRMQRSPLLVRRPRVTGVHARLF